MFYMWVRIILRIIINHNHDGKRGKQGEIKSEWKEEEKGEKERSNSNTTIIVIMITKQIPLPQRLHVLLYYCI